MKQIVISARNNLEIPIRLTLTNSGDKDDDCRILITVGVEGAVLKGFYGVCADTDLPPSEDWNDFGLLCIETKSKVSITGEARQ